MADIKANNDNTIPLSSSFDLQINSGLEAIAQDVRISVHTSRGEWFLDTTAGLDIIKTTGKGAGRFLDSEIKRVVMKRPGIFNMKNYKREISGNGLHEITATIISQEGEFPINL